MMSHDVATKTTECTNIIFYIDFVRLNLIVTLQQLSKAIEFALQNRFAFYIPL